MTGTANEMDMKVLTAGVSRKPAAPLQCVAGAQPDYIKKASMIRVLRSGSGRITLRLLHTGHLAATAARAFADGALITRVVRKHA
jgi:hypothetical protein